MRNREEEGTPLVNIERHPLVLIIFIAATAGLAWFNFELFKVKNPLGFIMIAPTTILFIQTLWLLLTPFAMIFEDRLDIRQSFFHQKRRYFADLRQAAINKDGKFFVVYHDDEVERINLFGIRNSHVSLLKQELDRSLNSPIEKK